MRAAGTSLLSVLLGMAIALAAPTQGLGQEQQQEGSVDVAVQNRVSSHTRVYALQEGHMVPLGTVEGMADTALSLPPIFLQSDEPIQLVADVIGSSDWYRSEPVSVDSTSEIEFTVESALDTSTVTVSD